MKADLSGRAVNDVEVWKPLHSSVAEAFTDLLGLTWEIENIESTSGVWDEMRSSIARDGLYYGMGEPGVPCPVLIGFDADFGALVSEKSLRFLPAADDATYKPSSLDLILFSPVAKTLEAELKELFSILEPSRPASFAFRNKGTAPTDIDLLKGIEIWTKVIFSIRESDGDRFGGHSDDDSEASDPDKAVPRRRLNFQIILPPNLVPKRRLQDIDLGRPVVLNLDDPWTQHMRRSLDEALVPVRAVVETCRMSVADCTRLHIGQIIQLPGVSLQSVKLETKMKAKSVDFGVGALGIYKSHRAIKLAEDICYEFSQEVDI